jgi:hypothetical protein
MQENKEYKKEMQHKIAQDYQEFVESINEVTSGLENCSFN